MKRSENSGAPGLESLSTRERAVLDLAVVGHIDEKIAQELGVSASTVNSYWVRIRGKIGQLSRTEIVGMVLRTEAAAQQFELVAENARMREANVALWANLARAQSEVAALRGATWHLLALDRLPEATFVTTGEGIVEYANAEAHRLYRAEPSELEGLPMTELSVRSEGALEAPDASEESDRVVLGLQRPYFALRRDGSSFRAVYTAEPFETPTDLMTVATLRPFLEDMDAVIRALRTPPETM